MKLKYSSSSQIFQLYSLDKFMIGHKGYIAGGCFKNIFNGEKVKDVDVFFENEEDYYNAIVNFDDSDEYNHYYESDNVTAYKHIETGVTLELVRSVFGKPEEVISNFDFTITKFAYYKSTSEDGQTEYKAVYNDDYFEHLHLHKLVIDDVIPKPMSTFERVLRYRKYGYVPCTETKQKLINALMALPEDAILVPTNFYNGVD